jgi:K+-transporting ATPase ATPase C chain
LVHNPTIKKDQIPADLVTASGSGLDPDISIQSARIQVPRIAKLRRVTSEHVNFIIENVKEQPLFGLFGPEKVNVLKLNLALDEM